MEKTPKWSGILRGNCCETYRNIPQKTSTNEFTKKNSLVRQILFQKVCSNFLQITEMFEVAIASRFVLFEVVMIIYLRIVKDSSECFWQSNLFLPNRQYRKN